MHLCAILLLAGVAFAADDPQAAIEQETQALQGTWNGVALEQNGKNREFDGVQVVTLVVKDNELSFQYANNMEQRVQFTLDPKQKPKRIDLTMLDEPRKGLTVPTIYSLDKNVLRLCLNNSPKPDQAPTELATKLRDNLLIYTFERQDPNAKPEPEPTDPLVRARAKVAKQRGFEGRLVDLKLKPLAGAVVLPFSTGQSGPVPDPDLKQSDPVLRQALLEARTTTPLGHFRCAPGLARAAQQNMATIRITTAQKCEFEVNFPVKEDALIRVPTVLDAVVKGPAEVAVGELAGVVVDEAGQPLAGVEVDVWDWHPGNEATTGEDGVFRIEGLGRDERVQVRFRKPGYSPEMFLRAPTGVSGWVVALGSRTYLEGIVRGPDGNPAGGALIRANQGPKSNDGVRITEIWTEVTADDQGRYRLYLQPDEYELLVSAKDVGVLRVPRRVVEYGTAEKLDVELDLPITFKAKVVDAETKQPVPAARLWNWQHKDVEARSGDDGTLAIAGMLPGDFSFSVDAAGYTRWWSPDTKAGKRAPPREGTNWIRDFDPLHFEIRQGMPEATILVEKGVRIRGRVVDPEGKPVAEATVAPALTGTGNSVTGDTRFSVTTDAEGRFEMLLPASHNAKYNLVAHDGQYTRQVLTWRRWANGVLPPIQTKPGQELDGIELQLTTPAVVRGKVVDKQGQPIPHRQVRAHAADKLENRYYDPATKTKEDGTFELPYIRPGEHYIQVSPFWMQAETAPPASTKKLTLTAGQTVADVELVGADPR